MYCLSLTISTSLGVAGCTPQPEPPGPLAAIWAVDDGSKVKADDLRHPLKEQNGIFSAKAPAVRLFGMRNETVAFQLVLQGGDVDTGVQLSLPAVGTIKNERTSEDPDSFYLGRRIIIYRQHYLEVRERSRSIPWEPDSAAMPKGPTGPVPDALIPLLGDGATLRVPARRNQAFWIDIYIPKGTPAQVHRGVLQVLIGGAPCDLPACRLPIELEVLDRTMPDQATARTMLYFSGGDTHREMMPARYFDNPLEVSDAAMEALRDRHFKLMRRHRVTGIIGDDDQPTEALRRRLSGEAFRAGAGYQGPAEGAGQDIYSIHTYGAKELSLEQARAWNAWLSANAKAALSFYYVLDEPGPDDFGKVNRRARAAAPLLAFVTADYTPQLQADIFCAPTEDYTRIAAGRARAAGKQLWVYNGRRPHAGSYMLDDVAVSPRVNPWIQYKYDVPRWFYWEATYYVDFQGGREHVDVWSEANTFRNADGDRLNGDGLLIYPGRDRVFPDQDRGLDLPLPSIRLKNWRRGIEDVEYLAAARASGHGAFVDELLSMLVPAALGEKLDGDSVPWPEEGEKWLEARRKLFVLLKTEEPPTLAREAFAPSPAPLLDRLVRGYRQAARWGKNHLLPCGAAGVFLASLLAWLIYPRRRRR